MPRFAAMRCFVASLPSLYRTCEVLEAFRASSIDT